MTTNDYFDQDIDAALNLFLSYIHPEDWRKRTESIRKRIDIGLNNPTSLELDLQKMMPISVSDDRIDWYLYLMHSLLYDFNSYEPYQGARIAPIFKKLGENVEKLKSLEGFESRTKKLLKKDKRDADAVLFEFLTALMYLNDGYEVRFVAERSTKTPDLEVTKGDESWFVECKRLSQNSDYSVRERNQWLKLLTPIGAYLSAAGLSLDITFHVELHTLDDNYLMVNLLPLLLTAQKWPVVVNNDMWSVKMSKLDLDKANNFVKEFDVKQSSPKVRQLLDLNPESTGLTISMKTNTRYYEDAENVHFINHIANASAIDRYCDAPEAIHAKARNIWRQINDAIDQIPFDAQAIIHVGLETFDGPEIELVRFQKITQELAVLDTKGKDIQFIYCNFFQSYALSYEIWTADETVAKFPRDDMRSLPLSNEFMVIPKEVELKNTTHWERPFPE